MSIIYNFQPTPKRYDKNVDALKAQIAKYNLDSDIVKKLFPEIKEQVFIDIKHKPLKQDARFYKDTIYLNFANGIYYLWAGVCHESAHILLRKAGWEQTMAYKELKSRFRYDLDQTIAILAQAYYENIAGIRKLDWADWQSTFSGMQVEYVGKKLFGLFIHEVNNKNFSLLKFIEDNYKKINLK